MKTKDGVELTEGVVFVWEAYFDSCDLRHDEDMIDDSQLPKRLTAILKDGGITINGSWHSIDLFYSSRRAAQKAFLDEMERERAKINRKMAMITEKVIG